jgi:hypothetical protein
MRRAGYKSIYGTPCKVLFAPAPEPEPCPVVDPCDSVEALAAFAAMVESLRVAVKEFFPATVVTGAMITKINATAAMNHFTFVRFAWIMDPDNKGLIFNSRNREHLLQLRDIYLKNRMSWDATTDPEVAALVV